MFGSSRLEAAKRGFASRFQVEEGRLVFRRSPTSPAVPVTEAERDSFVAAFARSYSRTTWILTAALFAAIALSVTADVLLDIHTEALLVPGIVAMAAGLFFSIVRIWNAPARALANRLPVAPGLDRDEARRRAMQRLTWGRLTAAGAMTLFGLWRLTSGVDVLHGWNCLWLAAWVAAVVAILGAAIRKWRYGRK